MPSANNKSLESWIWDAACSIRGAQEAPKFKDFILPLIFTKRLCDVFDDELNRIAQEVGSRAKAFKLVERDHKLVRFYLPLKPANPDEAVWSVIRTLTGKIGEHLTTYLHDIAKANPALEGIIDRMDFNATTHGQRDIDDDRLSNLIERISEKRLGLNDVEADILGRSYEYLIRKFAEGSGQSAGEFFTPPEVARIMARIMDPDPGMSVYDPCCGSAGLLIACEHALDEKMKVRSIPKYAPLRIHGQEYVATTWAMANMNMIIHDMEGTIEIGDTFKNPKFREGNRLQTFDRVVSNPMWNQDWFKEEDYDADELGRFPRGAGFPAAQSADWGWAQHILASLNANGRAAIVLDTGATYRGSGSSQKDKEREIRKWFIDEDLIEGVIYLPDNLFYNTSASGVILVLNRSKSHAQKGHFILVNASALYEKGDPKNYIPGSAIEAIAQAFITWQNIDHLSSVVSVAQVVSNDYNISPSRYIQSSSRTVMRARFDVLEDIKIQRVKLDNLRSRLEAALLRLTDSSPADDDAWTVKPFGELVDFHLGRTPSRSDPRFWENGKYPWVSIADMPPFGIVQATAECVSEVAHTEVFRRALVPAGTPLMSFKLTIGRVARMGIDGYHNEAIISFKPKSDEIEEDYLFYFLAQLNYATYQDKAVKGHTLNKSKLEGLPIRYPKSLDEQRRIAGVLRLSQEVAQTEEALAGLHHELFDSLLVGLCDRSVSTAGTDLAQPNRDNFLAATVRK
jgi:type I restriction enzyme M protein